MAYAIFDMPAIHGVPIVKEPGLASPEMVSPLVIAPTRLLQVVNNSSVKASHCRASRSAQVNPMVLQMRTEARPASRGQPSRHATRGS